MNSSKISIKLMTPEDWETHKELRFETLREEPWAFSNLPEPLENRTEEMWRRVSYTPGRIQTFALYDHDTPIGLSAVSAIKDSNDTAALYHSYIRKPYRGQGYSDYFYRVRLQWALDHGFDYAQIFFRQSNEISLKAGEKWGFAHQDTTPDVIFNGETDNRLRYRLTLADIAPRLANLNHTKPIPLLINQ